MIYALVRKGRVVWVGQTMRMAERLSGHARERTFDGYVILQRGLASIVDAERAEAYWLAVFRHTGSPLQNRKFPKMVSVRAAAWTQTPPEVVAAIRAGRDA